MNKLIITAGLIGGFMWWGNMKLLKDRRGLRNNNPGNIERNSTRWEGMSTDQSGDSRFVVFVDPRYGIRAMAKILVSYQRRGVVTVRQVINTWAPPHENDTESYVASVASKTGIGADERIAREHYPKVIEAIIYHENGIQPYSESLIKEGVSMAWA